MRARRPQPAPVDSGSPAGLDLGRRVRVLRVIARMNMGGPAYHVALLSGRLDPQRYETLLVHGSVGPGEGSFEDLAAKEGCRVEVVGALSPELSPVEDPRALLALIRIVRRFRPDIVHTHTAKAGFLGRLAAVLAGQPRPVIVHTYHGHVLEGYFGRPKSELYRLLEQLTARFSDVLIAVSRATVDDLVRLRVAPRERFRVVPIGLDLERFSDAGAETGVELRNELGLSEGSVLLAYVGRLVPIKRVDILLRAMRRLRDAGAPVHLAIAGDGTSRPELEALAAKLGVQDSVAFLGYRPDAVPINTAADIAVLSSDNEGTPVAIIEAAAAGRPAVATRVGGVPDVVAEGSGLLVPSGDHLAFARATGELIEDPKRRRQMGAQARRHVLERFATRRLIGDMEATYAELLGARRTPLTR